MALTYIVHIILFFVSTLYTELSETHALTDPCFKHIENPFFATSTGNGAFMTHTYVRFDPSFIHRPHGVMAVFRISVTMMSRLILNFNSYGDRHERQSLVQPNAAVGLQPSVQFSTHVTHCSSWVARTAQEFGTEFEWETSTGCTSSGDSGPTDEVRSDEEHALHGNV